MKRTTKRPSYRTAVEWIALNDSAGDDATTEDIAGWISTLLAADLFGSEPMVMAADIAAARARNRGLCPHGCRDGHLHDLRGEPRGHRGTVTMIPACSPRPRT